MKAVLLLLFAFFPLLGFAEPPSTQATEKVEKYLSSQEPNGFWVGLNTIHTWEYRGEAWVASRGEIVGKLTDIARAENPLDGFPTEKESETLYRKLHVTYTLRKMQNEGVDVVLPDADFRSLFEQYHRMLDDRGTNDLYTLLETLSVFNLPSAELDRLLAKEIMSSDPLAQNEMKLAAAGLYLERRKQVECAPGDRFAAGVAEELARLHLNYSGKEEGAKARALLQPMLVDLVRGPYEPGVEVNQVMLREAQALNIIPPAAVLCKAVLRTEEGS